MENSQKIGVVTVTYNSEEVLPEFLRSLFAQSHSNFILYAVDNASADRSVELVKAQTDSRVQIFKNSENLGVAEGNNVGIRAALDGGCDAILLLNNDVVFETDLFTKLLEGLGQFKCDMIAPKILYHDPADRLWWAGGGFERRFLYRTYHRGMDAVDSGQFDSAQKVEYAPTCCVLIRKTVFSTIGLMDAKYFVYYDDTDFMFRAKRRALLLYYMPSARLYHKVSSLTGSTLSDFSVAKFARNRVYFIRKHFGYLIAAYALISLSAVYLLRAACKHESNHTLSLQLRSMVSGLMMNPNRP